jgi:hypothetical protein
MKRAFFGNADPAVNKGQTAKARELTRMKILAEISGLTACQKSKYFTHGGNRI